jgi:hypothetical protein
VKLLTIVILLGIVLCVFSNSLSAQLSALTTVIDSTLALPKRFTKRIEKRAAKTEAALAKKTQQYLRRLQKQEEKLQSKLQKIDSTAAVKLFNGVPQQYQQLQQQITSKTGQLKGKTHQYLPLLDTLGTTLKFLEQYHQQLGAVGKNAKRIKTATDKLNGLSDQLKQTEALQQFLKERRRLLSEQLTKYDMAGDLLKYKKELYYYQAQVKEYKELLNQPDKLMAKGIGMLSKLSFFKGFMSKHSELAALFPAFDPTSPLVGAGLQTRNQVQQQIVDGLGSAALSPTGGAGGGLQQNLQAAQRQLQQLKNKVKELGGGSEDWELPKGYTPNAQRTKSFWKRLEYTTNFQSTRASYAFPTTTDMGLSIGYKINNQAIAGLGTSFKMGLGNNIRNIKFSAEGLSLRSFFDCKLKGSFYATAGFEYNYQQPVTTLRTLQPLSSWTQSALIGVSKIVSVKSKYLKKTKLQLLWDPISYQQRPLTQPVKFRVGYGF